MDPLQEATSTQLRIDEIGKYRASILELIEKIETSDRKAIQSVDSNPIHVTSRMENYVRNIKREPVKLTNNMFEIEHHLSHMRSLQISELLNIHAQWKILINQQLTGSQEQFSGSQLQFAPSAIEVPPSLH